MACEPLSFPIESGSRPNTRFLPSADQLGSAALRSSFSKGLGVPPPASIRYVRQTFPRSRAMTANCLPSGDQCAMKTSRYSGFNCTLSDPSSARARHNLPSLSLHATHIPSREKSTRVALARKEGAGWKPLFTSNFCIPSGWSSPRKKIREPDRAATGDKKRRGPLVNWTSVAVRPLPLICHKSPPACITYALPSAVQEPQQAERCSGSGVRTRCGVPPVFCSCQIPKVWVTGSTRVKRNSLPSGDHRIQKARPFKCANGVVTPSFNRMTARSPPLAYKMLTPSGIHEASWARTLPTRSALPPEEGTIQSGCSEEDDK